jgi:release factor glutamine methyltransferase
MQIAAGASIGALQAKLPLDPLENRILLGQVLGLSRVQLITQSERTLTEEEAARLAALVQRRLDGEPIAYLVGTREFYGLPFKVTPDVLIPRPDTELLVELALERCPPRGRVLDLGTGSGAIAVSIAHTRPDAQVTAVDVSHGALAVAHDNAQAHAPRLRLLHSDWYAALGSEVFDLIVSNPPYIPAGDPHLSQGDLRHEPVGALTDHADGLSALRRIAAEAPMHLVESGWLLMEHGYDQAAQVRALLAQTGWQQVQSWRDLAGIERVTGGVRPAASASLA